MDFYDGGAEDESTLEQNHLAFAAHPLWPKVFGGIADIDLTRSLLGHTRRLPFGIAPMGALGFAWPNADLDLCRAAAESGTVYTLSTMASASIEDIAASDCAHRWFQAHLFQPREKTGDLIRRAQDAGYEALVITADLPVGGKRERDLRNRLTLPFKPGARHMIDFVRHLPWLASLLKHGIPDLPNLPVTRHHDTGSPIGHGFDSGFDWRGFDTIRSVWNGPLVLKGILRPDDAALASARGADAIWVSNHGGRQLDGCVASLTALPLVKAAVGGRVPVFYDGGIRRGQHILKAYALGADFVFIGRAAAYGIGSGGQSGASLALHILTDELRRAMQLCGIGDLDMAHILTGDQSAVPCSAHLCR